MPEINDDYLSESDNFDTQRLYLMANVRVVSAVYPRDATVSQLLHNKPNIDELTGNLAPAEMDLIQFARSSCKDSTTRCSLSVRTFPVHLQTNGRHHAARHLMCS